ncbi:class I SAM-dependent methyltransferase [Thalassoglobus polymorphus]|uniref:RNA cap guanine-N2 methyltransferase n=1 Tax=Thalassoglobus polymorphus TaxID=2527994 RepID=A0A517QMB4_9PLAN|nr:class I SAM-dependent methyltransferase [Thalassoglobus polymorphus]QDT32763.1 RNA cap guanine-N2 methyltransferase [Thalassoglobus polymorphus]
MTLQDPESEILLQLQKHPELFAAIESSDESEFKRQQSLREKYPAELVRAALTLCELRSKAKDKFSKGDQMWFDRKGLEQSTPEAVANHKAKRFQHATSPIYDLCSGIGSDSIAMASVGKNVHSVDELPVAGIRTMLNAAIYGVQDRITTEACDVRSLDLGGHWIHIDPDRRSSQKRAVRLEDYEPPLEFLQQLTESTPAGAMKLSPASNFGGKFQNCEIELISLNGECKEATVWYGDAAGECDWTATILPAGYTLTANPWDHYPRVGELNDYMYDPDPAIVRAGLLDALADQIGLTRLDDAEEYLTSAKLISTPAATPFRVLATLPNNAKEMRKYFRDHPVGEVEIKCRHVPTNADQLRKKLPLKGHGRATLFIARLQGKTKAVVAERVTA